MGIFDSLFSRNFERTVIMKLSEISANLAAVDAQLTKAQAEILNRISELQAALADVEVPAEATEALDRLAASAKSLDDIVPDA
jgi:hypothetical protein